MVPTPSLVSQVARCLQGVRVTPHIITERTRCNIPPIAINCCIPKEGWVSARLKFWMLQCWHDVFLFAFLLLAVIITFFKQYYIFPRMLTDSDANEIKSYWKEIVSLSPSTCSGTLIRGPCAYSFRTAAQSVTEGVQLAGTNLCCVPQQDFFVGAICRVILGCLLLLMQVRRDRDGWSFRPLPLVMVVCHGDTMEGFWRIFQLEVGPSCGCRAAPRQHTPHFFPSRLRLQAGLFRWSIGPSGPQ